MQGIRRIVLTLDVRRRREQGGVETVGIAAEDEAPDQVRLEVEERTGQFVRVDVPQRPALHQVQCDRERRRRAPGAQACQAEAHCVVLLLLRAEHHVVETPQRQEPLDFRPDLRLVLQATHATLLPRVDLRLADLGILLHQVEPEQGLQFLIGEQVLQREPQGGVDLIRPGGQLHEQVVPEQVALGELEAGVVQRLEDAVGVVVLPGGHGHDRQAGDDGGLDLRQGQRLLFTVSRRLTQPEQLRQEELVGFADPGAFGSVRGVLDPSAVGATVGLGGQDLVAEVAVLPLVDQVLLVDPIGVHGAFVLSPVVADSGEEERQRRQPLLPVHHEPPLDATGPVVPEAGENEGADEVSRRKVVPAAVGDVHDVLPQSLPLRAAPGVRPLIERDRVLVGAPEEFLKGDFTRGDHVTSLTGALAEERPPVQPGPRPDPERAGPDSDTDVNVPGTTQPILMWQYHARTPRACC